MADYLIRRDGRYSYRRRYPREVAEALKRSEFVKALGTADPKEAARLARAVSVQFDNECEKALRKLSRTPAMASEGESAVHTLPSDAEVAKDVLGRLPGIIRQMTELVIAEQARNKAGWMDQIDWRRRALKEHIAARDQCDNATIPQKKRCRQWTVDTATSAARTTDAQLCNVEINDYEARTGNFHRPYERQAFPSSNA